MPQKDVEQSAEEPAHGWTVDVDGDVLTRLVTGRVDVEATSFGDTALGEKAKRGGVTGCTSGC